MASARGSCMWTGWTLAALCAAAPARADDVVPRVVAREGILNLRSGDVATADLPNLLNAASMRIEPGRRYVLRLDGPLDPDRRAALERAGVVLRGYLPLNAFLADLGNAEPAAFRALKFLVWAGPYLDAWKIDPALLAPQPAWQTAQRRRIAARADRAVNLWLFEGARPEATLAALNKTPGAAVIHAGAVAGGWCIAATLPQKAVAGLAALADVQYAEELPEYSARSNAITRWVVQTNTPAQAPYYAAGITGAGQIAGVIDGWVAWQHCSFADPAHPIGPAHRKILAYNASPGYDWHGTHVACTAVGDSGDDTDLRGIAYGARMVFNTWPDATEPSVFDHFNLHYQQGARVHTDSWGTNFTSAYDGACRAIDALQHDADDQLVLFAVSDGSLIRNPENAKNCLAVAADGEAPAQDAFCFGGAGPTDDGRRKPEIMAPGCGIVSAAGQTGCQVTVASGTSMACPAVAGAALLARQYFTDGFYPARVPIPGAGFTPSGALLKAVLINSAVDVTGIPGFPSPTEGWGRVLLANALPLPSSPRALAVRDVRNADPRALSTGQRHTLPLTVLAGQPLKATLAWADAPAAANAAFTPVNNIDLVVTDPAGTVYRGNVFAGGVSAPGGAPDALNNLEQVLIPAPAPGMWRIDVLGAAVNAGRQGYALAVTGALASMPCAADTNFDGGVTMEDLLLFLDLYNLGNPAADLSGDGGVTIEDLLLILEHYQAGC